MFAATARRRAGSGVRRQVIGQAMAAACRTVEGRLPHSLHRYFILPGDPQIRSSTRSSGARRQELSRPAGSPRSSTAMRSSRSWRRSISMRNCVRPSGKTPDVPLLKNYGRGGGEQPIFREMPESSAAITKSRPPDRTAPGRAQSPSGRRSRTAGSMSGSDRLETVRRSGAAYVRAVDASDFSLLDSAMARYGRPVRQAHDVREPRSRRCGSSPVPRRRMAALRPGLAERTGRPRLYARHDLQAGRHAGGTGGAGRLAAPAQVERAQTLASVASSTSVLRRQPAGEPAIRRGQGDDEDAEERGHDRTPEKLEPGAIENDAAVRAFDVGAHRA